MIPSNCGDKNIVETIIIVIADGNTHAVEADVQSGAGCNISEVAFAIVAIQRHRRRLLAWRNFARPISRVDEQQVLRAIVVEIEERHPATHGLGEKLFAVGAIIVDEVNPRCRHHIREARFRNFGRGAFRGCGKAGACPAGAPFALMLEVPKLSKDHHS